MNNARKPSDYKSIAFWGARLGSFFDYITGKDSYSYYIACQQELACQDAAPLDAIYYDESGKRWHRLCKATNLRVIEPAKQTGLI